MLRKTIYATLVLFFMTEAVYAQTPPTSGGSGGSLPKPGLHFNEDQGKVPRTKEQQEYDKALDRAYQSAIKKIPEQNKPDPWGGIRPAPSAAAKNKQQ